MKIFACLKFVVCCLFSAYCLTAIVGCGSAPSQTAEKSKKKKKDAAEAEEQPAAPAPYQAPKFQSMQQGWDVLRAAVEEEDQRKRFAAIAYLGKQGEKAVEPANKIMLDPSEDLRIRISACKVLGAVGTPAKDELVAALDTKDRMIRVNAIEQLALLKPLPEDVIDLLIEHLDDEDIQVQRLALGSLAKIGPPAARAEPKLQAMLDDQNENETLRSGAKDALLKVAPRKTFVD